MENSPKLKVIHGEVYASSLDISEKFGVKHKNVLQAIDNRLRRLKSQPSNADFAAAEFIESTYQNKQNHNQKMYMLTEEGFAMSVFFFQTERALEWQVRYIREFKAMKQRLHKHALASLEAKYVKDAYLPFGESVVRSSVALGDAVRHLHILRLYPEMTTARLKGMIRRGELEGHPDGRGYMRIYADQLTKLATGGTTGQEVGQ